ncbi:MAG: RsmE family RNA methyltransferase [bacterium]|nr:RsmE family RNA methyltransferase [bacterium]
MSYRAFVAEAIIDGVGADQTLILDDKTAHRFVKVLRLKSGEKVELFDGTGRLAVGILEIAEISYLKQVQITNYKSDATRIILLQALIKMDKLEQVVQRNTELGVSEIILFNADRSQVNFKGKADHKIERLTRIARDASRQCERVDVPKIAGPYSLVESLQECALFSGLKVMGDIGQAQNLTSLLSGKTQISKGVLVVIGPEGGFSATEKASLENAGFIASSWSNQILRSDTAGMAAVAIIANWPS